MDIHFIPPQLQKLDTFKCEALALALFADERPLTGMLGLVDWRMCGLVSRLITHDRLRGDWNERVLIAARPKLSIDKLFLFGVGRRSDFDEHRLRQTISAMLCTLTSAKVRASVVALPGLIDGLVEPSRSMELFLEEAKRHEEHDEVTLVADLDLQKAMLPVLERARRKARAEHPGN